MATTLHGALDAPLGRFIDPLDALALRLELGLFHGPAPQRLSIIRDTADLIPAATADAVRWRHAPRLDGHPVVDFVADALDEARRRVAAARAVWPSEVIPILDQSAALTRGRAELRIAADVLGQAQAMAVADGWGLAVSVSAVPAPAIGHPRTIATHANVYLRP